MPRPSFSPPPSPPSSFPSPLCCVVCKKRTVQGQERPWTVVLAHEWLELFGEEFILAASPAVRRQYTVCCDEDGQRLEAKRGELSLAAPLPDDSSTSSSHPPSPVPVSTMLQQRLRPRAPISITDKLTLHCVTDDHPRYSANSASQSASARTASFTVTVQVCIDCPSMVLASHPTIMLVFPSFSVPSLAPSPVSPPPLCSLLVTGTTPAPVESDIALSVALGRCRRISQSH